MEEIHCAPMLSSPRIGRKICDCNAVNATTVPMVSGPVRAGKPAAR